MKRTNFEQVLGKRKVKKKRIVIVIIGLLLFLCLFYIDGRQQYRCSIAKEAYEAMAAGRYREAYEKFELFKDSQSSFYWKLTEIFGEKEFRLGQIIENIAECDEKLKNNSTTETLWLGSWRGTIPGSKSDRAVLYFEDSAVLIDGEGNYVSEIYDNIYDELSTYNRYIRYVSGGKIGYLDAVSGEIAVPAQYKEASRMDRTAVVGNGRSAWFISEEGERLSENYEEAYSLAERQNTYARIKKGGKWGIINVNFEEVLPCEYDYINELPLTEYRTTGVKDGAAYIISLEKEPFQQKKVAEDCDIGEMNEMDGYAFITAQNGRKGLVDYSGEIVLEPIYQEISYPEHLYKGDTYDYDLVVSVRGSNGKYCLFALEGKRAVETLPMEFENKFGFNRTGRAVAEKDGKYGLIGQYAFDWIEIENAISVNDYSWGRAVAKMEDGFAVLDENGDTILYKDYTDIHDFWDGFAIAEKDGKYGFITDSGSKGLKPEYDSIIQLGTDSFLRDNYYLAEKDGKKQILYLYENGGRDLEYSVILDNIESVDERSMEEKSCWCVQLCDKENSRWFVSFWEGKAEMYIPLPDGAYCSGFCNMESDK